MEFKPIETEKNNYPVPQRYNTVVKANKLIQQSRFSLSTQQQKIILFIISKLNPFDDIDECEFNTIEFCKVCGIETKSDIYDIIRKQIKEIADKSIWIELENDTEALVRWIEKPYIEKGNGIIKLRLDKDMKPFLFQLKEKFTEYELIYTLNFKSKYSIRLYEYLKSIHYKKLERYTQTVEINKFQILLDSPYKLFKDFNSRVLKTAHKEINQYSDINFNYELVKQGKKVTHIKLTIETKKIVDKVNTINNNEKLLNENIKGNK
jgi:plasmid replication initiation protein